MVLALHAEAAHIDILVANAGIAEITPLHEMSPQSWDRMIATHLRGTFLCTRYVLPIMRAQGHGKIITMGSQLGQIGRAGWVHYAAAKGGIIAFTKAVAREVARSGVTANVVCPGPTDTALLHESAAKHRDAEAVLAAMARAVPMRRLARPEDIATAVRFFAAEETGYITGQTLSVSGGLTMA
jgi:2-hydroxycyclohexanecarboxyl-CoA dehydrogenase